MPWVRQDEKGNIYFEDGRSSLDTILHIKGKHIVLQLNDLYHIDTRADPARPDTLILPRIATFRKNLDRERSSLAAKDACTFVLCGDFLAPCYLSSLCDHGAQMVEVLRRLVRITCLFFALPRLDGIVPVAVEFIRCESVR